jgi:predicted regulator of Ras-like GTPase activity (Roadblock/LC7/MglB family)
MATIPEILVELTTSEAVRGSLVMMHDGIVVASALEPGAEADLISGLTSFLTSTMQRVLKEGGMGSFSSFTMQSTHGKVLVVDMGEAYLVVLTNQFGRLDVEDLNLSQCRRGVLKNGFRRSPGIVDDTRVPLRERREDAPKRTLIALAGA